MNMDKLPCGTSREKLIQARDAVIVPAMQADERRKAAGSRVDRLLAGCVTDSLRKLKRPDDLAVQWKVRDAVRPIAVNRMATINNLDRLDDEFVKREIRRAACDYIERHMPQRVA